MKRLKKLAVLCAGCLAFAGIAPVFPAETAVYAEETPTSGTCGENLTWNFDEATGTLTIEGSGKMQNWEYPHDGASGKKDPPPWFTFRDKISNIVLPDGLTAVGSHAFYGCQAVTTVTIPSKVTKIFSYAFCDCSLQTISLPDGLELIGIHAFDSCKKLTGIVIPNSVTSIGKYAFYNCAKLASVTIPEGVTSIGDSAFRICPSLTSVTIPGSVKSIGERTFYSCAGLTNVTISEGVTSIGDYAFGNCEGLTSITIPETVTSIGTDAFGTHKITIKGYVGSAADQYAQIHPYYCIFETIQTDMINGACGQNLKWSLNSETGTLSISGSGKMTDWDIKDYLRGFREIKAAPPWYSVKDKIKKVELPDGLTNIGSYAFYECTNLEKIVLPESITEIGDNAFARNESLISVTIPASCQKLGKTVFCNCKTLRQIVFLNSNTAFDYGLSYYNVDDAELYLDYWQISNNAPTWEEDDNGLLCCSNRPFFDGIVYGALGSTAEAFAKDYCNFVALDDETCWGDVNCDSSVDVADAVLICRFAVADAEAEITDQGRKQADVNHDGTVDAKDSEKLVQYIAKKLTADDLTHA